MPPDRVVEGLALAERPAGEGPRAGVRLAGALPEQGRRVCSRTCRTTASDGVKWAVVGSLTSLRLSGENLTKGLPACLAKRFEPPALLLVAAVALVRCGSDDDDAEPTTGTTTAEETLRVGLIVDEGQLDDNGFNELAFRGLMRAEDELGIHGRVVESASAVDYVPNMTSLARDGYDLIIGVGFAQGDALGKVAQRFPQTNFAIIDVDQAFVPGTPANVQGLLFREEEVGYLAGYLAGLTEQRRSGPDVISAVGGMKEPPVDRFIAGYKAGARKAAPGVKAAARLLAGLGRPGEMQGARAEPDRARLRRRVPGRRRLRPRGAERGRRAQPLGHRRRRRPVVLGDHILTSAKKGVDAAVFLTIESLLDGEFNGGANSTFGLKEEGVGLGTVSPDVAQDDIDQVEEIEQQIADGEIADIPTEVSAG